MVGQQGAAVTLTLGKPHRGDPGVEGGGGGLQVEGLGVRLRTLLCYEVQLSGVT